MHKNSLVKYSAVVENGWNVGECLINGYRVSAAVVKCCGRDGDIYMYVCIYVCVV